VGKRNFDVEPGEAKHVTEICTVIFIATEKSSFELSTPEYQTP